MDAATCSGFSLPSPSGRTCATRPPSSAMPPTSFRKMWELSPRITLSPGRQCVVVAIRLPIVPVGTKRPASLPSSAAPRSSSALIVGSSPKTSSPTTASAIAARISGVGSVTVSLRRSINGDKAGAPLGIGEFHGLNEW